MLVLRCITHTIEAERPERPTAGRRSMTASATIAPGPQHLRALQRANEVRLARAELKRRVTEGELTAAEVVLYSPWEAESMAIADLLMSQRRWGRTRCRRFLASVPLSETKTIGSLTERQRRAVASLLGMGVGPIEHEHTTLRVAAVA
jgi:hypothetical protein